MKKYIKEMSSIKYPRSEYNDLIEKILKYVKKNKIRKNQDIMAYFKSINSNNLKYILENESCLVFVIKDADLIYSKDFISRVDNLSPYNLLYHDIKKEVYYLGLKNVDELKIYLKNNQEFSKKIIGNYINSDEMLLNIFI